MKNADICMTELGDAGPSYYSRSFWLVISHISVPHYYLDISIAGIRSLGPGAPSTEYFPFYGMDWDAASAEALRAAGKKTPETTTRVHAGKHDSQNGESIYDIAIALQYGQGTGSSQLLTFLSEHVNVSYMTSDFRERVEKS